MEYIDLCRCYFIRDRKLDVYVKRLTSDTLFAMKTKFIGRLDMLTEVYVAANVERQLELPAIEALNCCPVVVQFCMLRYLPTTSEGQEEPYTVRKPGSGPDFAVPPPPLPPAKIQCQSCSVREEHFLRVL